MQESDLITPRTNTNNGNSPLSVQLPSERQNSPSISSWQAGAPTEEGVGIAPPKTPKRAKIEAAPGEEPLTATTMTIPPTVSAEEKPSALDTLTSTWAQSALQSPATGAPTRPSGTPSGTSNVPLSPGSLWPHVKSPSRAVKEAPTVASQSGDKHDRGDPMDVSPHAGSPTKQSFSSSDSIRELRTIGRSDLSDEEAEAAVALKSLADRARRTPVTKPVARAPVRTDPPQQSVDELLSRRLAELKEIQRSLPTESQSAPVTPRGSAGVRPPVSILDALKHLEQVAPPVEPPTQDGLLLQRKLAELQQLQKDAHRHKHKRKPSPPRLVDKDGKTPLSELAAGGKAVHPSVMQLRMLANTQASSHSGTPSRSVSPADHNATTTSTSVVGMRRNGGRGRSSKNGPSESAIREAVKMAASHADSTNTSATTSPSLSALPPPNMPVMGTLHSPPLLPSLKPLTPPVLPRTSLSLSDRGNSAVPAVQSVINANVAQAQLMAQHQLELEALQRQQKQQWEQLQLLQHQNIQAALPQGPRPNIWPTQAPAMNAPALSARTMPSLPSLYGTSIGSQYPYRSFGRTPPSTMADISGIKATNPALYDQLAQFQRRSSVEKQIPIRPPLYSSASSAPPAPQNMSSESTIMDTNMSDVPAPKQTTETTDPVAPRTSSLEPRSQERVLPDTKSETSELASPQISPQQPVNRSGAPSPIRSESILSQPSTSTYRDLKVNTELGQPLEQSPSLKSPQEGDESHLPAWVLVHRNYPLHRRKRGPQTPRKPAPES